MKKIALFAFAIFLMLSGVSLAVDSSWTDGTLAQIDNAGKFMKLSYTFTAHSSTAAIITKTPSDDEYREIQAHPLLCFVATDPGSTGPTNGAWDVTLVGATTANTDITGGAAANLSSTVGQIYQTKDAAGNYTCVPIIENFAITITGNAVNSATATVTLVFYKP